MNKIESIRLSILTGASGHSEPVRIVFNGHELELELESGSTEPGANFVGSFDVHSVGHRVFLQAPQSGTWEIRSLQASFVGPEPLENSFQDVSLAPGDSLDIWTPPVVSFDV